MNNEKRPIRAAQVGDVLTDANGMWMVDDVELTRSGKVRLRLRAGRTDRGHWTEEHDAERLVDLYTPHADLARDRESS